MAHASFWKRLFRPLTHRHPRRRSPSQVRVETLETRQLLSAVSPAELLEQFARMPEPARCESLPAATLPANLAAQHGPHSTQAPGHNTIPTKAQVSLATHVDRFLEAWEERSSAFGQWLSEIESFWQHRSRPSRCPGELPNSTSVDSASNVTNSQTGGLVTLPTSDSHLSSDLVALLARQAGAAVASGAVQTGLAVSALQTGAGLESFTVDQIGRIAVRVTATDVTALLPTLESLGFEPVQALPERHLVEGFLPVSALSSLDGLGGEGLLGVMPIYRPETAAGSVSNQADIVHESVRVRGSLPTGYDGTGITIGVLSDSYDTNTSASKHAADDVASGDLPAGVVVLQEGPPGSDEGRAMMQLIHDMAPGANLAFATAFLGEANFAQQIRNLAHPTLGNADIIVDDVSYLTEPFFQDGIIAQAVDDVAINYGVAYFSSAGNRATNAWETTSVTVTADAGGFAGSFVDFDTSAGVDTRQLITLNNGQRFRPSLQWDDPFYTASGVDTDLNIFLVDVGTTTIVASSTNNNPALQTPWELFDFTNSSGSSKQYELLIQVVTGPDPGRIKYVNFGSSGVVSEYLTNSPTVNPHAAATYGAGVAAVFYGSQTVPESFTSQGPTTILFAADGSRLASPEVRQSVRFAAVDGTDTTFFGNDSDSNGFPNFFGTSAAAPHAAAVAALIRQANPTFTPQQTYTRMAETATDIGATGFDDVTGAGLVNAYDAVFGPAVATGLNVTDGFEQAVLSSQWETHSTGPGRIQVTSSNGPLTGTQHLTLDTFASFGNGLNEAILHVDTTGKTDIQLTFSQKESNDEDNGMSSLFTGSQNSDGVAFSVDGVTWHRLVSLTGSSSTNAWQQFSYNLSTAAATAGVTLGSDVRIKFQQFDNSPFTDDGMAFDDVAVTGVDATPPTIQTLTPADNATSVDRTTDLQIVFSEPIVAGTGTITVLRASDNAVVQTVAVTSGAVSIVGSTVTVDLANLAAHTEYYVLIDSTAFQDLTALPFEGISNTSAWTFTTSNQVPIAQASSVSATEDTDYTFSAGDFLFTDAESDSLVSVTIGTVSLANGDSLTVDLGAGRVAVSAGMMITSAQIASLRYTPAGDANGAARTTFQFTVNDGDAGTAAATMTIGVTAVNDLPVALVSSASTAEETAKSFAISDFQFTDIEGDTLTSITIGALNLGSGDTLTVDLGAGPVTVTTGMTITAGQIPALLYTPGLNGIGSPRATFQFTVNDSGLGVTGATMSIAVMNVNDVPAALASSVTVPEDATRTFAVSDFQFTDSENDTLVSITIGTLSLGAGDTLTVDLGAGTVAVTEGMTITAGQIPTLQYLPVLNGTGSPRATFSFTVNDSGLGADSATMGITVTNVNDVPVAINSSILTPEDTPWTFSASDFDFADVEAEVLTSVTVISLNLAAGDSLTVDQGAGPVAITEGMTITSAQLSTLVYTPALNANGASRSTFEFTGNDGGQGTISAVMTLSVQAVNDAPVIGAFEPELSYSSGGPPVLIDANATVVDVDTPRFAGGELRYHLATNAETSDRLEIRQVNRVLAVGGGQVTYRGDVVGTVTGGAGSDLVITFNSYATAAAVQTVLRNVTFRSTSATPSPLARTLEVTLTDGDGATSVTASKTISLTGNLPPTAAMPQAAAVIALPETASFVAPSAAVGSEFQRPVTASRWSTTSIPALRVVPLRTEEWQWVVAEWTDRLDDAFATFDS